MTGVKRREPPGNPAQSPVGASNPQDAYPTDQTGVEGRKIASGQFQGSGLDRPAVHVEPGVRSGRPHIRGVAVDAITERLAAGDDAGQVCADFGLTRAELLVACWFDARYGDWTRWREWGGWRRRWQPVLARGGYDPAAVPLPTEEEITDG